MPPSLAPTTAATARKECRRIASFLSLSLLLTLILPVRIVVSNHFANRPPSFSPPLLAIRSFSRVSSPAPRSPLELYEAITLPKSTIILYSQGNSALLRRAGSELGHRSLRAVCQRSLPFLAEPVRNLFETV